MRRFLNKPVFFLLSGKEHPDGSLWRIVLLCLTPLGLLAAMLFVTERAIIFTRSIFPASRCLVEQHWLGLVVGSSFLLTALAYTGVSMHILRRIQRWHQTGYTAAVGGGLWILSMTALLVALPLLLGIVFH